MTCFFSLGMMYNIINISDMNIYFFLYILTYNQRYHILISRLSQERFLTGDCALCKESFAAERQKSAIIKQVQAIDSFNSVLFWRVFIVPILGAYLHRGKGPHPVADRLAR